MERGPRRLRNLDLQGEEDGEPVQSEHENLTDNENENLSDNDNGENLEGPSNVDGLLARLPPHQPRSPIKIICKFNSLSLAYSVAMSK